MQQIFFYPRSTKVRLRKPSQPWVAKQNKNTQTSATLNCKRQKEYADQRNPEMQSTMSLRHSNSKLHFMSIETSTPKHKCAPHYSAVHSQMWECAFRYSDMHKNVWIYRPSPNPLRATKKIRFYRIGRSTPRFYREGWFARNQIYVSLQFWAIDTTFLLKGLRDCKSNGVSLQLWAIDTTVLTRQLRTSKWNLRFATVLGDRKRVFSERVDFRLALPIPPSGIEK